MNQELRQACGRGDLPRAQALHAQGASPTATDDDGTQPILS